MPEEESKNLIESLEDLKYELLPNTQLYVIKDFEKVKETFAKAIEDLHINEVIEDDKAFKAYKKRRTSINKAKDKIKDVRLKLTEAVMGTFQEECKDLEKMLNDASDAMGKTVKAWDEAHKAPAAPVPPSYSITITSGSKKVIEKIRAFASKESDLVITANYDIEGGKQ